MNSSFSAEDARRSVVSVAINALEKNPTLSVPALADVMGVPNLYELVREIAPNAWERWVKPSISRKRTWWGVWCNRCQTWKPYAEMQFSQGRFPRCKVCNTNNVREIVARRNVSTPTVTEKRCSHCKNVKPSHDFYRSTRDLTGLQGYCKPCARTLRTKAAS